ncbi:MAG: endonuclease III domain-containing protein [Aquificaceae bacterium]
MRLKELYELLIDLYGLQNWWPVDEEYHRRKGTDKRDEIIIGAILTQNTGWKNVERALENLKREGELSLSFIREADIEELKRLIKPSGFYNQKAERLKRIAHFLNPTHKVKTVEREELLKLHGIGKETADAILLYAGERLSFVIDKYTQRFIGRFLKVKGSYEELKEFFENSLPKDLCIYKEFHALIDEHAKRYCRSTPLCGECPIRDKCLSASPSF